MQEKNGAMVNFEDTLFIGPSFIFSSPDSYRNFEGWSRPGVTATRIRKAIWLQRKCIFDYSERIILLFLIKVCFLMTRHLRYQDKHGIKFLEQIILFQTNIICLYI